MVMRLHFRGGRKPNSRAQYIYFCGIQAQNVHLSCNAPVVHHACVVHAVLPHMQCLPSEIHVSRKPEV